MTDKEILLEMHKQVIQAHLDADVDSWLDLETSDYISTNRGEISYPSKDERRAGRLPYSCARRAEKSRRLCASRCAAMPACDWPFKDQ